MRLLPYPVSVSKGFPRGSRHTGDMGLIPGWVDPLEKEVITHTSVLAWEISWTEETAGLHSMGSQKSQTQLSD